MPLEPDGLKDGLRKALSSPFPATVVEAAQRIADAYATYAQGASSCQAVPPVPASIAGAKVLLVENLAGALASGTAPSAAALMAAAMTTFWTVPPVAFQGATPGLVTVVAGGPILEAALAAVWVSNVVDEISTEGAAAQLAALLDAFTHTVVVTHAPPAPCASPLV